MGADTSAALREARERIAVTRAELAEPSRKGPASAVLHAHVAEQVAAIVDLDPQVRADEHDAVHQMRVACRRLRSSLATFRSLVDRAVTDAVRDELRWLAGVLGEARDVEVMNERLQTLAALEPADVAVEESSTHLERVLSDARDGAKVRMTNAMESARYRRLIELLVALTVRPPWTPSAHEPARTVLPNRVRRDWRRLRSDVAAAERPSSPDDRTDLLHEVRKTSKRLRYASEALVPAFGSDARRLAKAAERLQTVLGDHHDSAVSQQLLQDLAADPDLDTSHALLYGRLHALEQAQLAVTEEQYSEAWRRAAKKRLRRWL